MDEVDPLKRDIKIELTHEENELHQLVLQIKPTWDLNDLVIEVLCIYHSQIVRFLDCYHSQIVTVLV